MKLKLTYKIMQRKYIFKKMLQMFVQLKKKKRKEK